MVAPDDVARVAECQEQFAEFARTVGRDAPLYGFLASTIADDRALAGLLLRAPRAQRQPVLLFACVHFLLLRNPDDPLTAWYPNLARSATPAHPDGLMVAFAGFCARHADELAALLATRRTQTNEIGRCALFVPVFAAVAARVGSLAHLDVGASAGLNLLLDRYQIEYRPDGVTGGESAVRLTCDRRGPQPLPVPTDHAPVRNRVGLDVDPVDLTDPDRVRWLEACVWPDHVDRLERLTAAIELARNDPPDVRRGDAVADTPALVGALAASGHPVVTTSWVMSYLTPDERRRFMAGLDHTGRHTDLSLIYVENPALCPELPGSPDVGANRSVPTAVVLVTWRRGQRRTTHLADAHPHGRWMRWLHPT